MILDLLSRALPDEKIISVERFAEGYNNTAYDVKTDSGEYVLKVLRKDPHLRLIEKQAMIAQLLILKYKDFPIQDVLHVDYESQPPFALLGKIPGQSLKSVYAQIENKDELFEEIGYRYGQLHSLYFPANGFLSNTLDLKDPYADWAEYVEDKIQKSLQKASSFFDEKSFEKHVQCFNTNKHLLTLDVENCLSHGDSSLANIIVKKEQNKWKLSGFIDFEFASSGGAVFDLFKSLRTYKIKLNHADALVRGHDKTLLLPDQYSAMAKFYAWSSFIDSLPGIERLSWPDLSEEKTRNRRKKILEETLQELETITQAI